MRPDADTLLGNGLARSMPTSGALDRVAEKLNLPFFEDLRHKDNSEKALECLNDMVTNSLRHMEVCLKYMSDLHDPSIFRFCVIPRMRKRSTQNELATVNTVEIAKKNYLVSFVFDSLIKNYEVAASSVGEELFYHVVVQGALADAFVRENDLVVNAHGMAALVQLQTTLTLILLSTTDKMDCMKDATPIQTTWSGPLVDPAASKKKHVDSTSKSSKYMVILRLKQLIFSFKHYEGTPVLSNMRAAKYDLPTKMSGQEQYQEKNHSFGKRVRNSVTLKDVASGNRVSHLSQPSMSQNKIGHSNNKALKRLRAHDLLMINKHVADSLLGYTKIELASMWYDYRNLRPSSPSSSSFHDELSELLEEKITSVSIMQSMPNQQISQLWEELNKERATLASLQLRNQGTEVVQIFLGGTKFLKGR
ncbi:squalene synthase [Tanacetum coccineum]